MELDPVFTGEYDAKAIHDDITSFRRHVVEEDGGDGDGGGDGGRGLHSYTFHLNLSHFGPRAVLCPVIV